MNLYLVTKNDESDWDGCYGVVIVAPNKRIARNIIKSEEIFQANFDITIKYIGKAAIDTEPGILFKACR